MTNPGLQKFQPYALHLMPYVLKPWSYSVWTKKR